MSLREDKINLVVTINGDQSRKELGELSQKAFDLRDKMKGLEEDVRAFNKVSKESGDLNKQWKEKNDQLIAIRKEMNALTEGTKEYAAKEKELKKVETALQKIEEKQRAVDNRYFDLKKANDQYVAAGKELKSVNDSMDKIRGSLDLNQMTVKELNAELKKLNAIRQVLVPGTEAFDQNAASIRTVKTRLQELNQQVSISGGFWQRIKQQALEFSTLAAGYLGFQFIGDKMRNIIQQNSKLSDSLAEVRQTTGLTAKEMEELNKQLSTLGTRTSRQDLLNIAKIAGQFGVAKDQIKDFTEQMNKATVVLGSEFSGGAEEITSTLAGLRNVLSDTKTDKISRDLGFLGNALITLAQQGVATAPVVSDFANRIGGIGIPLGLSSGQVLGLSATMQELSITAERGGTAIGKILQKMAQNYEDFAKVAGAKTTEEVKKFGELVDKDIYQALLKFIDGVKRGGQGSLALAGILKDTELSGSGASEVLSKLSSNVSLIEEKVKTAGDALKNTTQITEQYNIKNENLGGILDRIGKRISGWVSGLSSLGGLTIFAKTIEEAIVPAQEDMVKVTAENVRQNKLHGESAQRLLNEYERLTADGLTPTQAQKDRLKVVTLQLKDALGENVVQIDKETGALKLNKEAVQAAIKEKLLLANQDASTLALKANALSDDNKKLIDNGRLLKDELETRTLIIKNFNISETAAASYYQKLLEGGAAATGLERQLGKERVDAINQYIASLNALSQNNQKVKEQDLERKRILTELKSLGFSEKDINNLFDTTEKLTTKTNDLATSTTSAGKAMASTTQNAKSMKDVFGDLQKQIEKLNKEFNDSGLNPDEAELQKIRERYQPLIDQARANEVKNPDGSSNPNDQFYQERLKLEEQLNAALLAKKAEFMERDAQARQQAEEQIRLALLSDGDKEIAQAATKWDKLIELAEKYGLDTAALVQAKGIELESIRKKQQKKEFDDQREHDKKLKEERLRTYEDIRRGGQIVADIYGSIFELMGTSQEEQAMYMKELALFQQGINAGIAVSNAIVSASALPYPSNLIAIGSAISAVLGFMVQAKNLIDKESVPARNQSANVLEDGGSVVLDGPRHSQGGLDIINRMTGQKVAESEGGELHVFSRKFVERNPSLVQAMMDASNNNNGVIRRPFWLDAEPMVINMPRVQKAERYRQFENGGRIIEFSSTSNDKNEATNASNNGSITNDILKELNTLLISNYQLMKELQEKGVPAYMINSQFDRMRETWEKMKSASKAG